MSGLWCTKAASSTCRLMVDSREIERERKERNKGRGNEKGGGDKERRREREREREREKERERVCVWVKPNILVAGDVSFSSFLNYCHY